MIKSQWRFFPNVFSLSFLMSETARVLLTLFRQVPSHGFEPPDFSATKTAHRGDQGTCDLSPSVLLQIILNIPLPNNHCKTN